MTIFDPRFTDLDGGLMALTCLHVVAGNSTPIMPPVDWLSSILQRQIVGEITDGRLGLQPPVC
jgi:hypothetical protein